MSGKETKDKPYYFQPGNPGGPGRPAGSRDKKWSSLDYWFELVEAEWSEIKPETRVKVAIEAWKALIARKQFSATPEESVLATESTMKMLKMLQEVSGNNIRVGAGSDTIGVEDRRPPAQAEIPPAFGV